MSLEDLQKSARIKNNAEADRVCTNCCLFIGWSVILIFMCYIIGLVLVTLIKSSLEKDESSDQLLIIEEYLGSGSV